MARGGGVGRTLQAGAQHWRSLFGDWSLITGRGATKRDRGQVKFYPHEKGGQKTL